MNRTRLRALGLRVGRLPTGALNAITDVPGVRVGHVTIVEDAPRVLRTGVTAILPLEASYLERTVFAGFHSYNGFGELTGAHWLDEAGILTSPICLSSAFAVGLLRDTLLEDPQLHGIRQRLHQPVAAETFDGHLSDGWSGPVTRAHVREAIDKATGGTVDEGCVGGGTGMICHEFKSGIGTSSRRVATRVGTFTVGALVQANYGSRSELTVDGVPVGRHIGYDLVPSPHRRDEGSIVVVLATDAPLLPPQCKRLARRGGIGLARTGAFGANRSGDFVLCFSTANQLPFVERDIVENLRMLPNEQLNPMFRGVAEAVEESIINALLAARTTRGHGGLTAHELPEKLLVDVMTRYGRGPAD